MAWKFVCEKDGKRTELPCAYMDGYNFGDRLLEGVMFKVQIVGTKFKCSVAPTAESYMESLNKKKWLGKAESYAQIQDIFEETESGGEEVWIEDENGKIHPHIKHRPKPVAVTMANAASIMREIMGRTTGTPPDNQSKPKE